MKMFIERAEVGGNMAITNGIDQNNLNESANTLAASVT